jgi:hypothetical protein
VLSPKFADQNGRNSSLLNLLRPFLPLKKCPYQRTLGHSQIAEVMIRIEY